MGRKAVSYLLYALSVVFTALLLVLAVLSWRSSYVSPDAGNFWASVALLMPVILVLNLAMLIWWLVRRKWLVMLMPLAALAINMGYISAMVQLPDFGDGEGPHDIRVATLNTNGFNRKESRAVSSRAIASLMNRDQVDILCLQEFVEEPQWPADSIAALFASRMPYWVQDNSQAILSRYPILDHRYVRFPDSGNDYLWADLLYKGDTIRVFSVHLQTSGISSLRHRFRKDYNRDVPVEEMFGTLERNSRIRAQQVQQIRDMVDSTAFPVILAGDFNDTPSSYTYRKIKGDFTDGFRAAGSGYGGTFRYIGGVLRIDYIFYSDAFRCVRYFTADEDVSDHKAVIAELRFRPR